MATGSADGRTGRGSGVLLQELRADALALSPEHFAEKHGDAFLLLTAAGLSIPRGPSTTEVRLFDDGDGPAAAETTASLALVAYPVRRTGRSVGHLITVGRASNNDIVIPDLSISRFHAFLKEQGGGHVIQDAGSTNGTTLNGRSVPRQGHAAPLALKGGDTLRFGQVELTWLDAESLHAFVAQLER